MVTICPLGGVGQDFLITGHGSIETHLAGGRGARAKTFTVKNRPSSNARIAIGRP